MSLRVCWCVCSHVWSRVWSDEPRGRAFAGRSLSECVGPRVFASSPRLKLRSGPCVCALGCLCHCVSAGVGALECRCVRARVQKWVSVSWAEGAGLREQARPPATASRSAVCLWAPAGASRAGRRPARPARALLLPSLQAFGLSDPWALNRLSEATAGEDGLLARRAERRLFDAGAFLRAQGQLISLELPPTCGCPEAQARAQEGPRGYQGGAGS